MTIDELESKFKDTQAKFSEGALDPSEAKRRVEALNTMARLEKFPIKFELLDRDLDQELKYMSRFGTSENEAVLDASYDTTYEDFADVPSEE